MDDPKYELDFDEIDEMWEIYTFDDYGAIPVATCEHKADAELILRLLNEYASSCHEK